MYLKDLITRKKDSFGIIVFSYNVNWNEKNWFSFPNYSYDSFRKEPKDKWKKNIREMNDICRKNCWFDEKILRCGN